MQTRFFWGIKYILYSKSPFTPKIIQNGNSKIQEITYSLYSKAVVE
jgi:hypothetical protein